MKRTLSLPVFLLIAALPVYGQGAERPTDVPAIVTAGFVAYETNDARAALGVWLQGSPVSNPATIEQMIANLAPIEAAYGKIVGHEIVRVVPVSPSVRRVYAIARYEHGPLFMVLDCYRSGKDWIIPMFLTNTRAAEILPASLLAGEH